MSDEWELATEKTKAQEVIDHFAGDVGKLEYKELNVDLLAEYHAVCEKLKAMEDIREMLRANVLKCMGRDESATRGAFVCFVKSEKRSGSVDWKRMLADGEVTSEIMAKYRKPDTDVKKVEVKKMGG